MSIYAKLSEVTRNHINEKISEGYTSGKVFEYNSKDERNPISGWWNLTESGIEVSMNGELEEDNEELLSYAEAYDETNKELQEEMSSIPENFIGFFDEIAATEFFIDTYFDQVEVNGEDMYKRK